ncbi:hypothetical protein HY633_03680 [Candidatus Uhrbacteria bacterium]|nr:hypothetical protein [Candidatus Uhrbacteria bacterium]
MSCRRCSQQYPVPADSRPGTAYARPPFAHSTTAAAREQAWAAWEREPVPE